MPIGNGPDCYNGINKEEDEQIKLQDKVEKWWISLNDNYKYEMVEFYYPDDDHLRDSNVDDLWNGLDWNDKREIYRDERGEVYV